jgi:acyl-CoA synthetase (NDP forming)
LAPPPMYSAGAVAKALIPVIHNSQKPVVVALMGDRLIQEAIEHFRAAHIPEYRFPERVASALAILAERAEFLARPQAAPKKYTDIHPETVSAILEELTSKPDKRANGEFLPQETVNHILEAYGIATLPIELARTAGEAMEVAHRLGFPVALKVASPDIAHKSDVGGVLLNLEDDQAVEGGFVHITETARQAKPAADILGVHVQHMLPPGQEVILGAVQDQQFGPLVMFGSGGVEVEGLKDVAFALAPLPPGEAEYLLESTWAGRKLKGYRNLPAADQPGVVDAIERLAQLATDFPQFTEIEINPLRSLAQGQGVFAIDVRIRLHPA